MLISSYIYTYILGTILYLVSSPGQGWSRSRSRLVLVLVKVGQIHFDLIWYKNYLQYFLLFIIFSLFASVLAVQEIQDLKSRLAQKTSECEILKEVQTKKFMTSEAYSNMISIFDSALTEVAKKTIQSKASNQLSGSTSSVIINDSSEEISSNTQESNTVATQTEITGSVNGDSDMNESIESAENIEIISIREADNSPDKITENSPILPQNIFNGNISNGTAPMIAEITEFPVDSADSTVKSEPNSDAFNQLQANQGISNLGYQNLLQTQPQLQSFSMNLGQMNQLGNHKNSSDIKQEEGYLAIQQKKTQRLSMLKQRNAEGYFECHLCPYKSTYRNRSN